MRRSSLLVLIAALALAIAVPATAAPGADPAPSAEAAAKAKPKGKKKAGKCKPAKQKAKGKARRSLAADGAAKRKRAKGKRKCAKAKPKPKPSPRKRFRSPYEQRLLERYKQKREQVEERRESRPQAPTLQDVAPADGTYTSPSAPGLTVAVSNNSTRARVTYTLPKAAFGSETCQIKDVAVDVTGTLSLSQSTGNAYLTADWSAPNGDSAGATGTLAKDGGFQLGIRAMFEQPPGARTFCSGNAQLTGTLVKQ